MRGNGATVAVARQAVGWTQGDLARAACVSQAYISRVEGGQLDLEGDQLAAVAAALDVPPRLLAVRDSGLGASLPCVHHRRRRSRLTAVTARRIEGLTQLVSLSTSALVSNLPSVPDQRLTDVAASAGETPRRSAQRVRDFLNLGTEPIPNVVHLAEALGVTVVERDLGSDAQDGASLRLHGRWPVIVLNAALSPDRERFSAAHELGHLLMHPWDAVTAADSIEQEANQFAGALLLPERVATSELRGLTTRDFRRLLRLKEQWGMSMAALIEQAKSLEVVDERMYRGLRVTLNEYGWTKFEPGELEYESPMMVPRIVDSYIDDLGYAIDKLSTLALMLPHSFTKHYLKHRTDVRRTTEPSESRCGDVA